MIDAQSGEVAPLGPIELTGKYRAVLSLGCECETTFRIEGYFGKARPYSPFDWLVAPLPSVIDVLSDGGARLGLEVLPDGGGGTAKCGNYGVVYHHEFPRRNGKIVLSSANLDRCRSKLQYKYAQFASAAQAHPTLYIRGGVGTDAEGDVAVTQASTLNTLVARLEAISRRKDFALAILRKTGSCGGRIYSDRVEYDVALDSRVAVIDVEITDAWPAGGDPAAFEAVFARYGLARDAMRFDAAGDFPEFN